jgi:Phasin protein
MENRDSDTARIDAGFLVAVRSFHAFAEEIGRVSCTSFAQNAKLMDELGAARGVGEVVAIQTKFATGMLETINEQFQRMLSHMAEIPAGFAARAPAISAMQGMGSAATPAVPATDTAGKVAVHGPQAESAARPTRSDPQAALVLAGRAESATAQQSAKIDGDALQELAKVAAELRRTEAQAGKDIGADNDPRVAPDAGRGPQRA